MKYTIERFNLDYPNDDACLESLFNQKYKDLKKCPKCNKDTNFFKIKDRKCYSCQYCGYQIYPLKNTIFYKSSTPLRIWFYAIFLIANKNEHISAKSLEKQLGVTYKTAWRISKKINLLDRHDNKIRICR
jgi:transposase